MTLTDYSSMLASIFLQQGGEILSQPSSTGMAMVLIA
jgi:hypothetical protein